jgi:molybdopterin-guanine dinucleotide biosynthesis protein A
MSEKPLSSRVEGFVLTGGLSRRFGADKALTPVGGRPLLARAIAALQALGLRPRLVAADPVPYGGFGVDVVSSEQPGLGPAEGLRAALEASATPWILLLSNDMPGVDAPLLRTLLAALPPEDPPTVRAVCFGEVSARRHPLPGLYHRSLAPLLATLPGGIPLQRVLDEAPARILPAGSEETTRSLANINTPADLERFETGAGPVQGGKPDSATPESD